jgi:hypothetical protein
LMAAETKSLRERNPFTSVDKEPISKAQVSELFDNLRHLWEDTPLVTKPNAVDIGLDVGNLQAICLMVLHGKTFK